MRGSRRMNDGRSGQLTWVHPLHAVGEGIVGDQVVTSPPGVGENCVRRG